MSRRHHARLFLPEHTNVRNPWMPDEGTDGGNGGEGGPGGKPEEKAVPQSEVDRIVSERLARERAKFADYDDLKSKAAKLAEIEAANATDLDKAVAKATEDARAEVTNALIRERVLDKIEVAAAGKFRDIEDARLRLGQRASEFIKDGAIDTAAIAAAVESTLTAAPHLKADDRPGKPKPDPSQGSQSGGAKPTGVAAGRDMFTSRRPKPSPQSQPSP